MAARHILELEELGKRIAPALLIGPLLGSPQVAATDPTPATVPAAREVHPLAGQGQGTYTSPSLSPVARVNYVLEGLAALAQLGRVKVNGAVLGVIPGTLGRATGTLTFTNDKGSVTVDLQGPWQKGSYLLPLDWQYKVSAATGDYQNLTDQGMLKLAFKAVAAPVSATATVPSPQGIFTLIIAGGHKFVLPPKAESGVEGVALVGPISPVERLGVPNVLPLPGAVILIQTADGSAEVARGVADDNGQFHLRLAPGKYLLVPLPPQPGQILPRGTSQSFVVLDGQFTNVTVSYDSGIR